MVPFTLPVLGRSLHSANGAVKSYPGKRGGGGGSVDGAHPEVWINRSKEVACWCLFCPIGEVPLYSDCDERRTRVVDDFRLDCSKCVSEEMRCLGFRANEGCFRMLWLCACCRSSLLDVCVPKVRAMCFLCAKSKVKRVLQQQ